ncbi:hypothetical protein PFLUV_G00120540 [Perca fluviatilis]|uniref:Secreted protein n=1 Tax=Perca fluviatilis TaxID=8168 RepID=A0A6A5E666_PERFL|nr:hypothetical protein PFLUV_G00120540 [Perca fluviatilis]
MHASILLSLRLWTASDGTCNCGVSSAPDYPLCNTDLYKSGHGLMDCVFFEVIWHNCTSATSTLHVSVVPLRAP